MNYLAHAYLAGSSTGLLLGGMCGDFHKGALDTIADPPLRAGVRLHRRIDTYTDAHAVTRRSRSRISSERRRFAGVIVDVAYDHFLAVHWDRFSPLPLREFTRSVYRTLESNRARLPARFTEALPRMVEGDLLASYGDSSVMSRVLDRIADRLARGVRFHGSGMEVVRSYREWEEDFLEFFPQVQRFAELEVRVPPDEGAP